MNNNTGPINEISRQEAVQMARQRIQAGIQGVPDNRVDNYFNPTAHHHEEEMGDGEEDSEDEEDEEEEEQGMNVQRP